MNLHRLVAIVVLTLAAAGCQLGNIADPHGEECSETFGEDGLVSGIDLDAPDWLPAGLPLPEGWSIRHANSQTDAYSSTRLLTGFLAHGDAAVIVDTLRARFEEAGYEILLEADGFVPVHVAFVALVDKPGVVVMVDVTGTELPVHTDDDTCPWVDGILISMRFDDVDPTTARASYAGSYLTTGTASANVAGQDFTGVGECFVHDGSFTFSGTHSPFIELRFHEFDGRFIGFAGVYAGDEIDFILDHPVSGVDPVFGITDDGFFVEGGFLDAVENLGIVEGRIEASCSP